MAGCMCIRKRSMAPNNTPEANALQGYLFKRAADQLFAGGRAATGDHLHFLHIERALRSRRRAHAAGRRRAARGGTATGAGAGAATGIGACALAGAAAFRTTNTDLMSHMIAQLGGVSRQLIGLARLVGQSEIAGRTAETSFNRLASSIRSGRGLSGLCGGVT